MRYALVSDIHGNLPALEAVVKDIERRGVDQILCLGDNLSGPLLPRETAQYLMASDWVVLAGNHERQLLDVPNLPENKSGSSDRYAYAQLHEAELQWVRGLRSEFSLSDEVFLCHGTPRKDDEHFLDSVRAPAVGGFSLHGFLSVATSNETAERLGDVKAGLVACGHSHVPRALRSTQGQLLVNPGSVGLQAYYDSEPFRYDVQMGTPDASYAIVEQSAQGWQCEFYWVPYTFESMARLAQTNGRAEWAKWLRTGYLG